MVKDKNNYLYKITCNIFMEKKNNKDDSIVRKNSKNRSCKYNIDLDKENSNEIIIIKERSIIFILF